MAVNFPARGQGLYHHTITTLSDMNLILRVIKQHACCLFTGNRALLCRWTTRGIEEGSKWRFHFGAKPGYDIQSARHVGRNLIRDRPGDPKFMLDRSNLEGRHLLGSWGCDGWDTEWSLQTDESRWDRGMVNNCLSSNTWWHVPKHPSGTGWSPWGFIQEDKAQKERQDIDKLITVPGRPSWAAGIWVQRLCC